MQPKIITSFFATNGAPALGLSPTIRIWTVSKTGDTLIVTDEPLSEVGDGFYKYHFDNYDKDNDYAIRIDGGSGLRPGERYQVASNESFADDVTGSVWDESKIDHLQPGTFGEALASIDSDVEQLRLDVTAMYALVELLVKYETNRTRIDKDAKTLTVFDDDGVTPLQVFSLFDSRGEPSIDEVCERIPD